MTFLEEINALVAACGLPVETGIFSGVPPDEYVVITPLSDSFENYADNRPGADIQEARLSLFTKGNYNVKKNALVRALLNADFTVTDRRYIEDETDTKLHHIAVDCGKIYNCEE
jgi:hypothetical protein